MRKKELQEIREGLHKLLVRVQTMEDHCKELSDMLLTRMDRTNDLEEIEWERQAREWELFESEFVSASSKFKGCTHV